MKISSSLYRRGHPSCTLPAMPGGFTDLHFRSHIQQRSYFFLARTLHWSVGRYAKLVAPRFLPGNKISMVTGFLPGNKISKATGFPHGNKISMVTGFLPDNKVSKATNGVTLLQATWLQETGNTLHSSHIDVGDISNERFFVTWKVSSKPSVLIIKVLLPRTIEVFLLARQKLSSQGVMLPKVIFEWLIQTIQCKKLICSPKFDHQESFEHYFVW